MDADLVRLAFGVAGAAEDKAHIAARLADALCQQQRRAAGRVELLVVVALDDLDIRLREHGGGALGEIRQHRDAERHIRREKDGNGLRGVLDLLQLLRALAGRGDHDGETAHDAVAEQAPGLDVVGKVDDAVGLALELLERLVNAGLGAEREAAADARGNREVGGLLDAGCEHATHAPVGAVDDNLHSVPPKAQIRSVPDRACTWPAAATSPRSSA